MPSSSFETGSTAAVPNHDSHATSAIRTGHLHFIRAPNDRSNHQFVTCFRLRCIKKLGLFVILGCVGRLSRRNSFGEDRGSLLSDGRFFVPALLPARDRRPRRRRNATNSHFEPFQLVTAIHRVVDPRARPVANRDPLAVQVPVQILRGCRPSSSALVGPGTGFGAVSGTSRRTQRSRSGRPGLKVARLGVVFRAVPGADAVAVFGPCLAAVEDLMHRLDGAASAAKVIRAARPDWRGCRGARQQFWRTSSAQMLRPSPIIGHSASRTAPSGPASAGCSSSRRWK